MLLLPPVESHIQKSRLNDGCHVCTSCQYPERHRLYQLDVLNSECIDFERAIIEHTSAVLQCPYYNYLVDKGCKDSHYETLDQAELDIIKFQGKIKWNRR